MTADAAHPARPQRASRLRDGSFFTGLRGRLLVLTVMFVLLSELVILPPNAANARQQWLNERVQTAQTASLAVDAAPDGRVSEELSRELLEKAQVIAVAAIGDGMREIVLGPSMEIDGPLVRIDLRTEGRLEAMANAAGHLLAPKGRYLQILVEPGMTGDPVMEVITPEAPLRAELAQRLAQVVLMSLIVSAVTGFLVYLAVYRLVVRPMHELTVSVMRFASAPEGEQPQLPPAGSDEIRRAQSALQDMQRQVSASFRQRKRLADLGEAVAKINHDLRNSLAAAQVVSEGLSRSEDPRVQRAAPRLERAIERAIALAEATLRYGRAEPPAPRLETVRLHAAIEDAAQEALAGFAGVAWRNETPEGLSVRVDADHLHRAVGNLLRNAAQALTGERRKPEGSRMEISARAERHGDVVRILIADTGPGIEPGMRKRLFEAFSTSGSRDGTGLGLTITRELIGGMGGAIVLASSDGEETVFEVTLPAG